MVSVKDTSGILVFLYFRGPNGLVARSLLNTPGNAVPETPVEGRRDLRGIPSYRFPCRRVSCFGSLNSNKDRRGGSLLAAASLGPASSRSTVRPPGHRQAH